MFLQFLVEIAFPAPEICFMQFLVEIALPAVVKFMPIFHFIPNWRRVDILVNELVVGYRSI